MAPLKRERIKKGDVFGRLTVLQDEPLKYGRLTKLEVQCECGKNNKVAVASLVTGRTRSCGCIIVERAKRLRYGYRTASKTHKAWVALNSRCYNPRNASYGHYGGSGITVCDEWKRDFISFYQHVGDPPSKSHSIDRIDNNGNYEPGNVRWATDREQSNNRRNSFFITYNNETLTIAQWARKLGIRCDTLWYRVRRSNWPIEKALTFTPNQKTI